MQYEWINAVLYISFNEYDQLAFSLKLSNNGHSKAKLTPIFLILDNIFIDTDPKVGISDPNSLWYCFPRRGSVINNIPISLSEPYSGLFPMQFIDVYNLDLGGIYVIKHDLSNEYKWFKLKKGQCCFIAN